MYTAFAAVYDRLMSGVDYDGWADYYAALLKRCGVGAGSVCECACGTGSLTVRLQRLGYAMTGIDLSQEMLSVAARKAREHGVMIPFVRQDMRRLTLHKPEQARQFFRAAFAALKPGGALIFDLSSPYKLQNTLGDSALGSQEEDIAYIWQNAWHPRTHTVDMRLSIFVRGADGRYERLEERQRQRAHSREELTAFLTEAGFTGVRFYGDRTLRAPTAKEARWHVTAMRPKEKTK